MQFQIVELRPKGFVPLKNRDKSPMLFDSGKAAAEAAKALSKARKRRCQPRPVSGSDDAWRKRETERFLSGQYKHLPWASADWWKNTEAAKDHFAHPSLHTPGSVAFTENTERGARDLQTTMTAGRYLTRYFANVLTADQIRDIATSFAASMEANELRFATTAEDMERVYRHGPNSCMSGGAAPRVRGYAGGDLSVAYIEVDNHVTARTIVWQAKKLWVEIYGDSARLRPLLEAAGYRRAKTGDMHLARLGEPVRCPCGSHHCRDVTWPYFDFTYSGVLQDAKGHFIDCSTYL